MASIELDYKKPPFWIRLLGTPAITWQTQPFTLARRQARALLYYLADELQPVPRDWLIFLLWPDTPVATARRNLTRLLSYLRKALPHLDLLITTKTALALKSKRSQAVSSTSRPSVNRSREQTPLFSWRILKEINLNEYSYQ